MLSRPLVAITHDDQEHCGIDQKQSCDDHRRNGNVVQDISGFVRHFDRCCLASCCCAIGQKRQMG